MSAERDLNDGILEAELEPEDHEPMSETDKILKNLERFSREVRGISDYESLRSFCYDLNAANIHGNEPLCQQKKYHECPECFDCEAGNALLRYERRAL